MALLTNELRQLIENKEMGSPESIYIQLNLWKTPGKPLACQKGTNPSKGVFHILGSYQGPLPPIKRLEEEIKQTSVEEVLTTLPILYAYVEDQTFPVLKETTCSLFLKEETFKAIENCFDALQSNSLTFRVKVPQLCRALKGLKRGSAEPIFSVYLKGAEFEVEDMTNNVEKVSVDTIYIPVVIPPGYKHHPMVSYQKECIELNRQAAAKASSRLNPLMGSLVTPTSLVEPLNPTDPVREFIG